MKEGPLVKVILDYLCYQKGKFWRSNTGAAVIDGKNCYKRFVRFGTPGAADITGIIPGGKRVEIEVKGEKGRQSDDQKAFEEMICSHGGIYILAYSVDDVAKLFK